MMHSYRGVLALLAGISIAFGPAIVRADPIGSPLMRAEGRRPLLNRSASGRAAGIGFGVGKLPVRPLIGNLKACMLLCRFFDAQPELGHTLAFYNNNMFAPNAPNQINAYWREASYGQLSLTGRAYGWFMMPGTTGPNGFSRKAEYIQNNVINDTTLVTAAVKAADPTVDFSQFDGDGDGVVDCLYIVHAELDSGTDPTDQPAFTSSFSMNGLPPLQTNDGVVIDTYVVINEWLLGNNIGILTHETGHVFGLPDLYDPIAPGQPVRDGIFSLMSNGDRFSANQTQPGVGPPPPPANQSFTQGGDWPGQPGHLDPWAKIRFGWISPTVVNGDIPNAIVPPVEVTATAQPGPPANVVYKVFPNGDSSSLEYFLIENRQPAAPNPLRNGAPNFDQYLPGSGILIWHVDENVLNAYYSNNVVNNDATHKFLAVMEADGLNDLDTNTNYGDAKDFFPAGATQFLGSRDASPPPNPNSDTYDGSPSGLAITSFSSQAFNMVLNMAMRIVYSPTAQIIEPQANSTTPNYTPTVVALLSDPHANAPGFDPTTIRVTVDGVEVVSPDLGNVGTAFNSTTGEIRVTLPPQTAGLHVVAVSANDLSPAKNPVSASIHFTVAPRQLRAGLQMIGVPYILSRSTPNIVLGDPQPKVARYDGTKYHVYTADPTDVFVRSFVPSRGYWVNLANDIPLSLEGTSVPQQTYQFTYENANPDGSLPAGWLMIANPFSFPVDFNQLQVQYQGQTMQLSDAITANIILPTLYSFVSGSYSVSVAPDGVLQPFVGYWIRLLKPAVLLLPPLQSANVTQQPVRRQASTSGGWSLAVTARNDDGAHASVTIGASPGEDNGPSRMDAPEPPPVIDNGEGRVNVSVVHTDWGSRSGQYMQDIRRSPVTTSQSFDLLVATNEINRDVTVTWDNTVPKQYRMTLVDLDANTRRYMRTTQSYTFNSGPTGRRRLQVVIDPTAGTPMRIEDIQAVPGRSGAGMTFTYQLTQPALVDLEIMSATGRIVRHISQVQGQTGINHIDWDQRDDSGHRVPGGIYLLQVTATSDENQVGRGIRTFRTR